MSEENSQTMSAESFAQSLLPLFNGPFVKLRVASSAKDYNASVGLLAEKSSYFAKMFQSGRFIEGIEREATLEDMDGVVSPRSLEHLLQWIYIEKISFSSTEYPELISEILEFLRMADMCDVHGMEEVATDYLVDKVRQFEERERPRMITPQHIESAGLLPHEHSFRPVIAKLVMRNLIEDERFPFFDELSQAPGLSTDILKVARGVFRSGDLETGLDCWGEPYFSYTDPLLEKKRKTRK